MALLRTARVLVPLSLGLALVLVLPGLVPNAVGRLGSLTETFRPWLGLGVPVLAAVVPWRRRAATAGVVVGVPLVAWLVVFGAALVPRPGGPYDLTVVQHNVSDDNADPAGTARVLGAAGPDLVALEEVVAGGPEPAGLPYRAVRGTVGLWSRYPLAGVSAVDLRPAGFDASWNRGLRAVMRAPGGDVAVYVAHLPSMRIGPAGLGSGPRDESARRLGAALAAEPLQRVLLLGDLNSTLDDRGLDPVTTRMGPAPAGFAFSWPARAPVARIDQVLGRSVTVTRIWALPRSGSDHLPVAARVRLG